MASEGVSALTLTTDRLPVESSLRYTFQVIGASLPFGGHDRQTYPLNLSELHLFEWTVGPEKPFMEIRFSVKPSGTTRRVCLPRTFLFSQNKRALCSSQAHPDTSGEIVDADDHKRTRLKWHI